MESDATKFMDRKNLHNGINEYTIKLFSSRHPLFSLAQEYLKAFPGRDVHPEKKNFGLGFDLKDPSRAHILSYEKSLELNLVAKFLPKPVLKTLTGDSVRIKLEDGEGSYYDALENKIEAKGTPDFYHEIGHFYWNKAIIPAHNLVQRHAIMKSLSDNKTHRITLEDRLIPSAHKRYAQLVGAHSGQFLFPDGTFNRRMNDLDEHFARNFDYLVKGKPLEVLDRSKATLKDLLDFYQDVGVIDEEFRNFYEASIKQEYCSQGLRKIGPPYKMQDGDTMQIKDAANLLVLKKRIKAYAKHGIFPLPNLPIDLELGLRLDITPEFAEYCLDNDKKKVCEALVYTETGTEQMGWNIRKYKPKKC